MNDLLDLDRVNIWHPFSSLHGDTGLPLITSAKGVHLFTDDGKKIIDAISSWWVNLHGHGHPEIAGAISRQAETLEHVIFAGFTHEPAIRLSENLLSKLPNSHKKIFFSDNGSTAVEVAIKMAIQYWHNRGIQKRKVIAMKGAYHGDTFGAMSVAERGLFTKPFHAYLFETVFIDLPTEDNFANVREQFERLAAENDVAAFIFEPLVQAAGGMRMYSAEHLDALLESARQHEIVTIADEVFTGFGRTGKFLAADHLVRKPDIIALSKGITGGFLPLSVTSCSEKIIDAFNSPDISKTFFHGHSYTANPIACAAANASFDLLVSASCQERIEMISAMHAAFAEKVKDHAGVLEARTRGTVLAVELRTKENRGYENSLRKKIYPWFLKKGILLRPLGNVIYVVPPYVISSSNLQQIYRAIEEFLEALKTE